MANRWGKKMETVIDFIFFSSNIIAECDWSHEIKRCLLIGIKAMTNSDSVVKSRDITLPTKVHIVKNMVFSVVMYGKGQFSFQSQGKSMPKNVQTTSQCTHLTC